MQLRVGMAVILTLMEHVRKGIDPLATVGLAATFCYIASHNGCTQREIQVALQLPQTSVSRCTVALSSENTANTGRGGYGLITIEPDANDRRNNCCYLTGKGKQLAERLVLLLQ